MKDIVIISYIDVFKKPQQLFITEGVEEEWKKIQKVLTDWQSHYSFETDDGHHFIKSGRIVSVSRGDLVAGDKNCEKE